MNKAILIILLFVSLPVMATEYYVTTTGSDSNDGLAVDDAHAFLTPTHACSIVVPGDTVYIKGDGNPYTIDYNEPALCGVVDGTAEQRITVRGYDPNDRPTISWRTAYTGGWTNTGTNLWTSTVKYEDSNQDIQGMYLYDTSNGNVTILNKEFSTGAVDAEGDFYAYKGLSPSGKVLYYSATDPNTYTTEFRSVTGATGVDATGFKIASHYLVQHINTKFTYQGFVCGLTGVNRENITIEDCESDYGINRGFAVLASGVGVTMNNVTLRRIVAKNGLPSWDGYVTAPDQEGVKFGNGNPGILATNLLIEDFQVYNNGYAGMQNTNSTSNVIIRNGVCHDNNINVDVNIDGACVRFGSSPSEAQHNYEVSGMECYNARNCVTVYGDVNNVKIHNNYFHDFTQAAVYIDTSGATESCSEGTCDIYNNLIVNGAGSAILLDDAQGVNVYNNTIIGQSGNAIDAQDNSTYPISATIKNNIIIADTGANLLSVAEDGLLVADYNAYYSPDASPFLYEATNYSFSNYKSVSEQDTHSISSDFTTDFTDYAGGKYDIKDTATIKDLGINISLITEDYRHLSRPRGSSSAIGAYEELDASFMGGITITGTKVQ